MRSTPGENLLFVRRFANYLKILHVKIDGFDGAGKLLADLILAAIPLNGYLIIFSTIIYF